MTTRILAHEAEQSTPRRIGRNGVLQLGWPHFWLLIGILGMMLALVGWLFVAHLAPL